jgi:hypothetical protein
MAPQYLQQPLDFVLDQKQTKPEQKPLSFCKMQAVQGKILQRYKEFE